VSETRAAPGGDEAAAPSDPIAIVGIGCRYADSRGPAEFWEILRSGRNTVRDVPQHRIDLGYDIDHFYDPRLRIPGKVSSKKGGFLEHPELFDPAAFGIAPRDALTMEPQQRLMIEVTWDALEDAGIVPETLVGERVAVILGYMAEDYSRERTGVMGEEAVFRGHDVFTVGGMSHAVLSGRISFLLGVTGPSFTLDTACSSSLIATHLACQSLRRGESKLALAGGVNLFLSPEGNIALSRSGMLSMSGACKAFDASADGFVRAEGAGVVVLRPLADALEEGNPIYAVIRGSGISTDGRDGGHMMAPGRKGQAQAIRDAYAQAGISPADVHYVEAHGTGTTIGDPVEIGALADVMGPGRSADRPLRVASVKGNLGHTESASGVAALIKTALAIRHRELPKQLHFEHPTPAIPWDEIPIRVQTRNAPWPYPGPALAGVNSFGISGTNAHVVLSSAPEPIGQRAARDPSRRPILLPITGHDPNALHEMVQSHHDWILRRGDAGLEDLASTLCRRRTHREHRLSVVARSTDEVCRELGAYLAGNPSASVQSGIASREASSKIVMVFPGQGTQWLGMGRGLLGSEPAFAMSIDRLDAAYRGCVDWSLRALLDGSAGLDWTSKLDLLQPALVAVEIALAELWESWGIRPDRVIGQSMGEIAAAYIAGGLGLEDVARLVCNRGKIVATVSGRGAMALVSLPRDRVEAAIRAHGGRVEVAGSNSPTTTIVSGDRDAVTALVADFDSIGVFARRLDVDFASHCFHMEPLLEPFRACIEDIEARTLRIPFDSTVDACEKSGAQLDAGYWVRNLRAPVAFDQGLANCFEGGGEIFIEVSPHPTVSRAIEEIAAGLGRSAFCVSSLQRDQDEQRSMLTSLGELFVRGVGIDWEALHPSGQVVETPLYAYQRKRFWFSERNRSHRFRPVHPLLGARSQSSIDPRLHHWDFLLDSDSAGFIEDYSVAGRAQAPASLYPELALAAAEAVWPGESISVQNLEFGRPLIFPASGRCSVQAVLRADGEGSGELRISSRECEQADWALRAICALRPADSLEGQRAQTPLDREANDALASEPHFAALERCGVRLGPKCRTLRELESEPRREGAAGSLLARMMLPRVSESEWYAYRAHPAILEGCFQLIGALCEPAAGVRPVALGELRLVGELGSDCWCRVKRRESQSWPDSARGIVTADLEFFDREGAALGWLDGVRVEALPERADHKLSPSTGLSRVDWVEADLPHADLATEVDDWIIVSDSPAQAGILAAELQKQGASCHYCEKVEDLASLSDRMSGDGHGSWGLALLAWGDSAFGDSAFGDSAFCDSALEGSPASRRAFGIGSWASAIRDHCRGATQVWIATRRLQAVRPKDRPSLEAARLVPGEMAGLAHCATMQQCRLFDVGDGFDHPERVMLTSLMGRVTEERQFAVRGEHLYVPRLIEVDSCQTGEGGLTKRSDVVAGERNFRAVHSGEEGLECLALEEVVEPQIGSGEVVVEVRSAALSQLDVLTGLGLARGSAPKSHGVARDFAGVVRAVPDSACDFEVGEEVIGIASGALARRLAVPAAFLAPKPSFFDFDEAASLPFPFLVARYALQVVARLRAGERILILSAAGGVGQAMIGIAQSIGAEVSATASTSSRRATLHGLGVRVLDAASAASLVAADELEGCGDFDVIASAESGPAMHRVLARLAPGGRYLDLCPRNEFERAELGALRLAPNRSFSAIDVAAMMRTDAALVSALLQETADDVSRGRLLPLATTVFPVSQAGRALRYMAQNRHAGRVCVDLAAAGESRIRALERPGVALNGRGGFVVSGDETEIRSEVTAWLRGQGADDVVELAEDASWDLDSIPLPQSLAGWIHIASEAVPAADRVERLLPRVAAMPADFRAIISVREPVAGDAAGDRAWETRGWIDRLLLSGRGDAGRSFMLSVAGDSPPRRVARELGRAILGDASQTQLILLSANELSSRLVQAPSPLLASLKPASESGGPSHVLRAELLSQSPPERRISMQGFVCDALAGILGLSGEQREALDVGRQLDTLGLDSLMTMELFMGLGRDFELEVAANWFDAVPSLASIASVLLERLDEAMD